MWSALGYVMTDLKTRRASGRFSLLSAQHTARFGQPFWRDMILDRTTQPSGLYTNITCIHVQIKILTYELMKYGSQIYHSFTLLSGNDAPGKWEYISFLLSWTIIRRKSKTTWGRMHWDINDRYQTKTSFLSSYLWIHSPSFALSRLVVVLNHQPF